MQFAREFRRKWLPGLNIISEESINAEEAFLTDVGAYPTILIASKRTKPLSTQYTHPTGIKQTLEEMGHTVKVGPALGHTPAFVLEASDNDVQGEILFGARMST